MVTKPYAMKFWTQFSSAPQGWWQSPKADALVQKAIALVKATEGEDEAKALENLCTVAKAADKVLK